MRDKFGIRVFDGVDDAIRSGYEVLTIYPDRDGNLQARKKIDARHYAVALIRVDKRDAS